MLTVRLTILVVLATCGFSLPIEYEEDYPMDYSDLFEGDIKSRPELRIGLVDQRYYWPSATMYYTIDPSFSQTNVNYIQAAISEIEKHTCVRIVPRTDETNYVEIRNIPGQHCYSAYGMKGGAQVLNLDEGTCFKPGKGSAVHELLHALGLLHTHSAHNRDEFVTIDKNNIESEYMKDFDKVPLVDASDFGFGYDFGSIMHYKENAFAIDPYQPTIIPKHNPNTSVGQRVGMSAIDIKKINYMYGC